MTIDLNKVWPQLLAAEVQWRPGMLLLPTEEEGAYRVVSVHPNLRSVSDEDGWSYWHQGGVPDLADPATLGCLLAEIRRLSADSYARPVLMGDQNGVYQWFICIHNELRAPSDEESEAIIRALCALTGVAPC